ncbi:MAG: FAD-dependent oxidoreductase [Saprospiraceae bacterium]|nr:FAD-dependent oxidoreductase [Saprospiraceae bacterium]
MSENLQENQCCVVIGASHAGVNFAFAHRKAGWLGKIILIDKDPELPYHRPPLSKVALAQDADEEAQPLKPEESYQNENIELQLGREVLTINKDERKIILDNSEHIKFDKLVIATGGRALIPSIKGMDSVPKVYTMRTAADAARIRESVQESEFKRVVIIGGGYIGLEVAASLRKRGCLVSLLERESRLLPRVTSPYISDFFTKTHTGKGVSLFTDKNVVSLSDEGGTTKVICEDGTSYIADLVVVGVGIRINMELAIEAGLEAKNGIEVNEKCQTSEDGIYAIGDCCCHFSQRYQRWIRLESVQNAVDQAKIAAAVICGNEPPAEPVPWFWSDQYEHKLQMVGLSEGYNECIIREEIGDDIKFSIWYFEGDRLLAVDAVNNARAYVVGTKLLKENRIINKLNLQDPATVLKPLNIIAE